MNAGETVAVFCLLGIVLFFEITRHLGHGGAAQEIRLLRAAFREEVESNRDRETQSLAAAVRREEAAREEAIRERDAAELQLERRFRKLAAELPAAVALDLAKREGNGGPRSQRQPVSVRAPGGPADEPVIEVTRVESVRAPLPAPHVPPRRAPTLPLGQHPGELADDAGEEEEDPATRAFHRSDLIALQGGATS